MQKLQNQPLQQKITRLGRLLNSVKHFYGTDSTFVHSPIRDVLKVLYPEYESAIYSLDTVAGKRYVLRIPRDVPSSVDHLQEEEM